MSGNWLQPVEPVVTQAYCDSLSAENEGGKAKAFDTTFRYSDVMGCSRAMSYRAAGVEPTDSMDGPELAIAKIGTLGHEEEQAAYLVKYPEAEVEVKSRHGDLISGHADIVHHPQVVELKFVPPYKFDLASGVGRSGRRTKAGWVPPERKQPAGPDLNHVCQAGFNAKGLGMTQVRIVYNTRVAVSIDKAEEIGLSSMERLAAEWIVPPDVWRPLVEAEAIRLERIRSIAAGGKLTPRVWEDKGVERLVDPDDNKFPCTYCDFKQRCRMDGPGVVPVEITKREATA
jgi:hypothetical protein